METKLIEIIALWDFHGVLEKGNEYAVVEHFNQVMIDYGYSTRLILREVIDWYGLHWSDFFKKKIPNLTEEQIKDIVEHTDKYGMQFAKKHIKPNDYAEEVLSYIIKKNGINIVVSNTNPLNLKQFVDVIGLNNYFDSLIGVDQKDVTSNHNTTEYKLKKIKDYIKNKKFKKIILIDDNELGIDIGIKLGAKSYRYSRFGEIKSTKGIPIYDLREILKEL